MELKVITNDSKEKAFENINYVFDPEAIADSSTKKVQFSVRIQKDVLEAFYFIMVLEQAKTPLRKLHQNQAIQEIIMARYNQLLSELKEPNQLQLRKPLKGQFQSHLVQRVLDGKNI